MLKNVLMENARLKAALEAKAYQVPLPSTPKTPRARASPLESASSSDKATPAPSSVPSPCPSQPTPSVKRAVADVKSEAEIAEQLRHVDQHKLVERYDLSDKDGWQHLVSSLCKLDAALFQIFHPCCRSCRIVPSTPASDGSVNERSRLGS